MIYSLLKMQEEVSGGFYNKHLIKFICVHATSYAVVPSSQHLLGKSGAQSHVVGLYSGFRLCTCITNVHLIIFFF